jgi:hypothetical protein
VSADVYEALVRLGKHELELIEAGALEDAAEVQLRRAELLDRLPPEAPPAARAALERAAALQAQLTTALAGRLRELRAELGQVDRGRRAARGYGGVHRAPPARSVDHAV